GFRLVPYADADAMVAALDERVCAVLLEAVQGEGGVNPAPPGYLEAVRAWCDEREALLIFDEVQAGLGRTGRWFGHQHADVRPDVVTMAKALGNGVPIGACWARADVATALRPGDHATTFGGQPLAARAALAVLDVMEAEDIPQRAARAGEQLTKALLALPAVVDVRGWGLLLAAELEPRIESSAVARACLARGLTVNAVTPTALRSAPPLPCTDREITDAVRRRGAGGPRRSGCRAPVREAVDPHPHLDGDGRRRARRAPDLHPPRRGRDRGAGERRGRRSHAGRVLHDPRRPGIRPHHAGSHGGGGGRARREPSVGSRPSVPGARR